MTKRKLVASTATPTRNTKIIRFPGEGTKYNRTYERTNYVSRYTKTVSAGVDYTPPAPPEPEPEPPTTIGLISLTVDDVPVVWGEAVHVPVNTPVHAVATISGDANPNYKWAARGDYPLMVGSQTATTTLTFPQEGGPTVTLTATDSTATDSPINYAMNFYVASQTEWDILHPIKN